MQLGSLLGKLKGETKATPEQFLALVMTDDVVQAAVWHVRAEQTETISVGTPVEWDGDTGTTSELVTAVDATISSAVEGLSEEPTGVILGIPHSWTDKNGILGSKKTFIESISKELELKPLGFVVITDSIISYLKIQEGTPTSSIIVQVIRDELTFVLVRLGQIEAIETLGRSDDIVEDVTEGIARFKAADNLPSRIIMFNSMHNLDELIQNLLSVDWQKDFNFLHMPKVEALPKDVAIRALIVAGGAEVAKSLGFTVSQKAENEPPISTEREIKADEPTLLSAAEIGFIVDKPNLPAQEEKANFVDPEESIAEAETVPEELGKANIATTPPQAAPPRFKMPKISIPTFHLPSFKLNARGIKRHWWITGAGLVLFGLASFYVFWIVPKAVVTVQVTPKSLDQEVELTLSTKEDGIDFQGRIVPAQIEVVSAQGEKTEETTGKKIIGETASGQVTLYNRTTATKSFAKGTLLSVGNLKFSLDADVVVSSKSAGIDYVDVPGKASVGVSATAIGEASNLAAGTEFVIQNFGKDSYVGKNEVALVGGTAKEAQVVADADPKLLSAELTKELSSKLESNALMSSSPGTGVYLIPSSIKVEDATYSGKVGEVATTLTLNLTLTATLLRYATADVTTLINSTIDSAVPAGFVRANLPSTVDLSASVVSEGGDTVKGSAKVQIALLPVIDTQSMRSALRGNRADAIESILSTAVPGYLRTEVSISPRWLPPRFKSLPYNANNIVFQIVPSSP